LSAGPTPLLVHDYLLVMRGAERTFAAMAELWPGAPIATTLHDPKAINGAFRGHEIRTSYLQHLRLTQRSFRRLLPLYPSAVERLPVDDAPVVLSSSSAFAHGVRTREDGVHLCYCHNPFRYAWHERERALREVPALIRPALARTLERVRSWDRRVAQRVTRYVANSELCRERIAQFYEREATVVHPPVEVERFRTGEPGPEFVFVGELVAHKRVDTALEAARRAGARIRVIGTGPERDRLAGRYAGTAEFLGRVSDDELQHVLATSRALVVPNVEEFGIAAVEAQAAGRPVLAPNAGGTRETVLDGRTGVLVDDPSVDKLAEAMRYVDYDAFEPAAAVQNAQRFSKQEFQRRLRLELDATLRGGLADGRRDQVRPAVAV
jgi:glycosyltransferase involved in cell wall biosynthesis